MTKTLSVIGCGNVGKTLGRLWVLKGVFTLQDILNRSSESAKRSAIFIGAGRPITDFASLRPADVFLIGCPDDQIAACCHALANTGILRPGNIVFHCSGALASTELAPAMQCGALTASIHPIRSFANPEQVADSFSGTYCGTEGNPGAVTVLKAGFSAIGAELVPIDAAAKSIYHAAAVFASNYLVTLLDVAVSAYVKSGMPHDTALKLMAPLVHETVDNVFKLGPTKALSGPIARGDVATVVRQYRAVNQWDKRHGTLYKLLGKLTLEIAVRRRIIENDSNNDH